MAAQVTQRWITRGKEREVDGVRKEKERLTAADPKEVLQQQHPRSQREELLFEKKAQEKPVT